MSPPALMPSLARAVRGLSALFWGLPLALLAGAKTAMGDGWRAFGGLGAAPFGFGPQSQWLVGTLGACLPGAAALGLLLYGLRSLVRFQPQERVWVAALDRATLFNLLLLALLPFAHWWSLYPGQPMFLQSLGLFVFAGIGFLLALNRVLARLAALLPDEVLRADTRLFAALNRGLILLLGTLLLLEILALAAGTRLPATLLLVLGELAESRHAVLTVLALLPVALTMTLLWKAKEAIVASVFAPPGP
jgi:hypothetical protein